MFPLPVNPNVVLLLNKEGTLIAFSTNVAPELNVQVTTDIDAYEKMALGKTFKVIVPQPQSAVTVSFGSPEVRSVKFPKTV